MSSRASTALAGSYGAGERLAFELDDATERIEATTDVFDQLKVNRTEKFEFSNETDVDPFALPEGTPDVEPINSKTITYALCISILLGQKLLILA